MEIGYPRMKWLMSVLGCEWGGREWGEGRLENSERCGGSSGGDGGSGGGGGGKSIFIDLFILRVNQFLGIGW